MSGPVLRGTRVTLRPMTHDDAPRLVRWSADADFAWNQWGRAPGRFGDADVARQWIDRFGERAGMPFAIEHEGRPIGFASYRDLEPKARSAEVSIGIGEKALWGRALGREALALLVRHLVLDLRVHRVSLHVLAYNDRAINSYKAVGFRVEGLERDAVMTDRGHYADDVAMAYVVGRARPEFDPRPVTLAGRHVRLEPLRREHLAELWEVARDPEIWTYLLAPVPSGPNELARHVDDALEGQILGDQVVFLTRRAADGRAIGSTRFLHVDRTNKTAEIGWTFLGADARRTVANTEAKLLQLRHLFDELGAHRVWLQTDKINERSQRAIERLGATKEGELRDDRVAWNGRIRTSVVYGITRNEWPGVRRRLLGHLER
ncbi:MAG TPA: GNAT family N-acetyltransferase [Candidatus Limnocylindria bacterium]|nr:GNAT family N-acetyltransferase [Candidatus Limnocylindria bacterium]